jgi:transposase
LFVARLLGRLPHPSQEVSVEVVIDRCAGLDVHKDTVMACIRTPGKGRVRRQEVRQFRTFTAGLRELRDWLAAEQVTQVALEATGVYWRPVWHMLEDLPGTELLLVNAHHVKRVPGRKTDVSDAAWLAQLCECGLLRGSFVPPPVIAALRDLTRYRKKIIQERTRETQTSPETPRRRRHQTRVRRKPVAGTPRHHRLPGWRLLRR